MQGSRRNEEVGMREAKGNHAGGGMQRWTGGVEVTKRERPVSKINRGREKGPW